MEKPSLSNLNQHPAPRRRIRLIPATPRPTLPPPPPYSSSSTSSPLHSTSSSSDHQSGSPRGVVPRVDPGIGLLYPFYFRIGGTRNEVFQPPAPAPTQPPSTERLVPLVPTALRWNPSFEAETSRPRKKHGGHLFAEIIREVMPKIPPFSKGEEESLTPSSSSLLRFSSENDDEESDGVPTRKKRGKTFEEIADEVMHNMHQEEVEEEGQKPRGMAEEVRPSQPVPSVNNENPYEGLMQEMIDLKGTNDEVDAEEDEWRTNMEEKVDALVAKVDPMVTEVDALVAEVAEQHAQTTRLVNLVEKVVSLMDRETQSSNHPSPATSVAPLAGSQQPNADNAGPSRKRKETATIATRLLE